MTEKLLQQLEEKIVCLLTELEELHEELELLAQENEALKEEKQRYFSKLQNLVGIIDTLGLPERMLEKEDAKVLENEEAYEAEMAV